jgi:hypothetical protein
MGEKMSIFAEVIVWFDFRKMIIFGLILDLILKFISEKWDLKWHQKCAENGPRMATVNDPIMYRTQE